jgi:PAS domain S-box-containing protein
MVGRTRFMLHPIARPSTRAALWRISGPILTILLVCLAELVPLRRVPSLSLILTLAIAYSALIGGMRTGFLSSAVALVYVVLCYARSGPGRPVYYSPADLERVVVFAVAVPIVVLILGSLKRRLDELLVDERALRREAEAERGKAVNILESITDGFFAVDRQWRCTYANRQAEQMVGRKREELLGRVIWETFPPLVGSTWDREYHRAIEQQVPVHFEEYYPPLASWFETFAYPSQDGLTVYLRPINARKEAEESLRTRARQQAAIATFGKEALLGGELASLLDTAVRLVATTLDVELVKLLELLPETGDLVMRAGVGWRPGVEHRVPSGECSQAGYALATRRAVTVEDLSTESRFHGPRLLLEHGVVSGVSVVVMGRERPFGILGAHTRHKRTFSEDDVHFIEAIANVLAEAIQRKRNEEALAESEQRFRQLADNVHEVFYVGGAAPREILYVSPAFETIWGRPRASLYESPPSWLEAVHPDDRRAVEEGLARRGSGFFETEYRVVRPDGSVRWVRDRSSPVLDGSGRAFRVVGTVEDVTDLLEAAAAARGLAASEAAVRARDQVLAIVAHDLRNPLAAISMGASLLDAAWLTPEKRSRHAKIIKQAASRAERLIRDLLDVARLEAGQLRLEPAVLDIASLVTEACDLVSHQASEKSLRLECSGLEDVPRAYGDRDRILQALGNLLANAIKFTPREGSVAVRVRRSREEVELSVEDTGPGMSAEALAHVFERYWQARGDRRGLGLGLAIVKGIVDAHHGRVWAESEPGKGSAFHFTVPLAGERVDGAAAPERSGGNGGPRAAAQAGGS